MGRAAGRPTGSKGTSVIEREARKLRDEHFRIVATTCNTATNRKKLRAAVNRLYNAAESGDRGAFRIICEIERDVRSAATSDQVARYLGAPDLGEDFTTRDVQEWIRNTLPLLESEEGQRKFLDLSWEVFKLAAEREKIAAMRQASVPTTKVFQLWTLYDHVIQQVLSQPEHLHLLDQYLDLYEREILPRFPEVLEIEAAEPA